MLIPIRCFTCGNILASKYTKYKQLKQKHKVKSQETTARGRRILFWIRTGVQTIMQTQEKKL